MAKSIETAVDTTIARIARRILAMRNGSGHWQGELASSALSTATAAAALSVSMSRSPEFERLMRNGLRWLEQNRNPDGGWGDTVASRSNISTTALCWAAFALAGTASEGEKAAVAGAESWLRRAAGGLEAARLSEAIGSRYGKDRTFSVPILTVLALAGRLGSDREAWELVPQLPFELAALPRSFFQWLRLPVVSYALPALIAIGQARHHNAPSLNPVARIARNLSRGRTLRMLEEIQPRSGGYLEAVPLTSFVMLSLAAGPDRDHPVVGRGAEFLRTSARADGSWPIDVNLATWVTTLSVNALAVLPDFPALLSEDARSSILNWLLGQQFRTVHAFTGAAPGGWAWTDLPGGVPDADDTAGALLAMARLAPDDPRVRQAAMAGVLWLLGLQNRDGGMPTFCRGWGALPFDRSSPDLTGHALAAWCVWMDRLPAGIQARVRRGMLRAARYLRRVQRRDGAWIPLWFGNESVEGEENPTYGTARVVAALHEARHCGSEQVSAMTERGCRWLLSAQNPDGGWGGAAGAPSSIEETGLALGALSGASIAVAPALERAAHWLADHTALGAETPASPIGFYFARLWYSEALYPLVFALSGLAGMRMNSGSRT